MRRWQLACSMLGAMARLTPALRPLALPVPLFDRLLPQHEVTVGGEGRDQMQRTPAGLPSGIPGIGLEMEGAMQHAPQWGRQSMAVLVNELAWKAAIVHQHIRGPI